MIIGKNRGSRRCDEASRRRVVLVMGETSREKGRGLLGNSRS